MRDIHIPYETARTFEEVPQILVVKEVADMCCMTYCGVLYWIRQSRLKARKARGVWLIDKNDLLVFTKKRGIVLSFNTIERAF